jgi:putative ABC transport system ATP-binding protein
MVDVTRGPGGPYGDLLRVLELLAEQVGTDFDPAQAWAALQGVDAREGFVSAVKRAAARMGLRAQAVELTAAELRGRVGPGLPALTLAGSPTRGRWLLVTRAGRGGLVGRLVADGDESRVRLSGRALQRVLGQVSADAPTSWLLIEPALPFDALHARRVGAREPITRALGRLRALIHLERADLAVVMVYAVGIGALSLVSPIAVQALVNTVAFGSVLQPLFVLTLVLVAGLSFAAALKAFASFVVEVLQQRLFVRAVADVARRLPRVDLGDHKIGDHGAAHGPELVNRFFDVVTVQKASATLLLDGVSVALQAVVGMVLLAFYHPLLLAFDVALLIALAAIVMIPLRAAIGSSLHESSCKYETVAWLEEVARNPVLFKSEAGMRHAVSRAELLARGYLAARRAHFARLVRQLIGGLGLQVIAGAALLGVGGLLVLERQLTLGQLVAAELVVTAVSASFATLGKHLEKFYDLLSALEKLGKLIDLPLEPVGGAREFSNGPARVLVRGALPGRGNLEITAGERVLLTGGCGAGKSELLDFCFGLRRPAQGQIEVDGVDLRMADLPALRDQVALVRPGDLFHASILDNLRLGAPQASLTTLRVALSLVDLADAIGALPDGLETVLAPTGAPLSGAQARRLVLARALAAQPRLLLIDGLLDGLKLARDQHEALLEHIFAADAPWTVLVVSDDPRVRARCRRVLDLSPE